MSVILSLIFNMEINVEYHAIENPLKYSENIAYVG